jgi:hypothetical protein
MKTVLIISRQWRFSCNKDISQKVSVTIVSVFYNNINRFASGPLTASGTQGAISFFQFFEEAIPGLDA